jgi:hypothetical protein
VLSGFLENFITMKNMAGLYTKTRKQGQQPHTCDILKYLFLSGVGIFLEKKKILA